MSLNKHQSMHIYICIYIIKFNKFFKNTFKLPNSKVHNPCETGVVRNISFFVFFYHDTHYVVQVHEFIVIFI